MTLPPLPSTVGKKGSLLDIQGVRWRFSIIDEVRQLQSQFSADEVPGKIICLQLIRFDHNGAEELRLGYYIIGKKPRMAGKWVWGQYATLVPREDFKALIEKARAKGWL